MTCLMPAIEEQDKEMLNKGDNANIPPCLAQAGVQCPLSIEPASTFIYFYLF